MSRRIPLLDLSHYIRGTNQERDTFIKSWGDGLKEFGFVSIINHGVDPDVIARTYDDAARLFSLPGEVKRKYEVPGGGGQRGYTSFGKEHAKNRKVGDLKEFWHVGRELPPSSSKKSVYGDNQFPSELASFKANSLALYQALDATAAVMLRALADSFKLPTETFADMAHEGNSILR